MTTERKAADFSGIFNVPTAVGAVVREFRSCEFSTLARDGTPVTWPTLPFFDHTERRLLRRRAYRYLAVRHLQPPDVRWDLVKEAKARAKASLARKGQRPWR